MDTNYSKYFSNLYIDYYYGSLTHCGSNWRENNILCPFCKIYFITDGECEIKIEGKAYHGHKGRMFFIPSQTRHSFYHINDNYVTKYWIHFEVKAWDNQLTQNLNLPYYIDIKDDREVVKHFEDIFDQARENTLASAFRLKAGILSLLSDYIACSDCNQVTLYEENHPEFYSLISYINDNLHIRLTLDDLSGRMHMHPNYFIRLFKSRMGTTPLNYINKLRMERAKALLENTSLPVSELMLLVGFEDLSSFSNFFKHYSGYNPKVFRKTFGECKSQTKQSQWLLLLLVQPF